MISMFVESLKNLVTKPQTINYPFRPSPEPKGYRGTILYNEELCIFCDKCENICPPGAIKFEVVDIENNKKRNKLAKELLKYGIRTQKSVFECEISRKDLNKIKKIAKKFSYDTDLVSVYEIKEIDRIGGREPIKVDVRVIATTNRDINYSTNGELFFIYHIYTAFIFISI